MTEIKLDKVRKLKFTNRALYAIDDKLGVSAISIMQDAQQLQSRRNMTIFIWGGLLEGDNLTFEEVIDIIPQNMVDFMTVASVVVADMGKALGFDMPDEEKKKSKKA